MPAAFRRPLPTFLVIMHLVLFAERSNANGDHDAEPLVLQLSRHAPGEPAVVGDPV